MLIARHAGDRDGATQQAGSRAVKSSAQFLTSGRIIERHIEQLAQILVPATLVNIIEQGAAGIGGVGRVDLPPVSRHSKNVSMVPKARRPFGGRSCAIDMIEQPGDLGGGKIGIEQQAGAFRNQFFMALAFRALH